MLLSVLALLVHLTALSPQVLVRTFEDDRPGAAPAEFTTAAGREAEADRWVVTREGKGRVLVYQGQPGPADGFAVAVLTGARHEDVAITVRVKATSGRRMAGLVWKYRDPLNHYVVQLDLVRQELAMYRIRDGNRIRLEREDDLELDADAWHSLRVRQEDGEIRVYLGGIRVFTESDRQRRGPAGVGLWAAGDTTAMFDDLRVEPEAEDRPETDRRSEPRRKR